MTPQQRLTMTRAAAVRAHAQIDCGKETAAQLAGTLDLFKDEAEDVLVTFFGAFVRVMIEEAHAPGTADKRQATEHALDSFGLSSLHPELRARVVAAIVRQL